MKTFLHTGCALISIWLLLQVSACKKENTTLYPSPANLKMITSGYAMGAATKVEVYAANDLFIGYNIIHIALYDSVSNMRITQAQISLNALMKTGSGTSQSGPVENPTSTQAVNGLFNAAVVFTKPTASNSNWALSMQVQNQGNQKTGSFAGTVSVVQPSPAKAYSLIAKDDSASLFVCLLQPATPQLGANSFEVTIYRQISPMNFAPDSSYNVMIDAEMPSMSGMNSPNYVNPVYTGNGHYLGKVDFIMSGEWQINMSLLHNTALADSSHYFDLSL
jgi:hypothetical protein